MHSTPDFKLFVGAYAGFESFKEIDYETYEKKKVDSETSEINFMLGSKVGVLYLISDESSIELGMKLDTPLHLNIAITKFSTFAGITYKF